MITITVDYDTAVSEQEGKNDTAISAVTAISKATGKKTDPAIPRSRNYDECNYSSPSIGNPGEGKCSPGIGRRD